MARTKPAGRNEARQRLEYARACVEVAELVLEDVDSAMPGIAAGLAVLAGIGAADSICAVRLGMVHRGESHRDAAAPLREAVADGRRLGATLRKLLDRKDEARYGLTVVSVRRARDCVHWARVLANRATEEFGR
jgi:hypothetical protein